MRGIREDCCACCERPRYRRTARSYDEIAPSHCLPQRHSRLTPPSNYSRDLRAAKWVAEVRLHSSSPKRPMSARGQSRPGESRPMVHTCPLRSDSDPQRFRSSLSLRATNGHHIALPGKTKKNLQGGALPGSTVCDLPSPALRSRHDVHQKPRLAPVIAGPE
jgi:hypothetical protein